jgi:hypothetical protein
MNRYGIDERIVIDRGRHGDMDETSFVHQVEELPVIVDGVKMLADATWEGAITWEYDSGDWSVGIQDGFIGHVEECRLTNVRFWDFDAEELIDATPDQFRQVEESVKPDKRRIVRDNEP